VLIGILACAQCVLSQATCTAWHICISCLQAPSQVSKSLRGNCVSSHNRPSGTATHAAGKSYQNKIPTIVPKYKMPHPPRRDGSWLIKAYRDVTGCAQSLSCRHSGLFPASTFTIFLLLAFFAACYRFLQGQVPVDLDSGHKSKELASRETSF